MNCKVLRKRLRESKDITADAGGALDMIAVVCQDSNVVNLAG